MQIAIHTQYRENYGAHDWDGTGECPQYWKNKGGETYIVQGVDLPLTDRINAAAEAVVESMRQHIEQADHYCTTHIIDWEIVGDDYISDGISS